MDRVATFHLPRPKHVIFWPRFVRFEGYVPGDGFSVESLRGFEEMTQCNRVAIEAVMNHVHIADIHCDVEPTEAQLRYLGRMLKEMRQAKLGRDFPSAVRGVVQRRARP